MQNSPHGYVFYSGNFVKGLMEGSVKIFDIGCSDIENDSPLFTGTMKEGLLQGNGILNYYSGKKF